VIGLQIDPDPNRSLTRSIQTPVQIRRDPDRRPQNPSRNPDRNPLGSNRDPERKERGRDKERKGWKGRERNPY